MCDVAARLYHTSPIPNRTSIQTIRTIHPSNPLHGWRVPNMAAVAIIEASSSHIGNSDSDVARAAAGDRGAFERLYRAHVNRVFSLCARMVSDRTRAEELTQDVFVRAWEKLHLFRGESSFATWLHRLTVNVVLNARKSDGRAKSRFEEND